MGAIAREPSMEDILASIRKIVSQDSSAPPAPATRGPAAAPLPPQRSQTPEPQQKAGGADASAAEPKRQSFSDFARNVTGARNDAAMAPSQAEAPLKPALANRPGQADSSDTANGAARPPSLSGLLKSVRESWPQQQQKGASGAPAAESTAAALGTGAQAHKPATPALRKEIEPAPATSERASNSALPNERRVQAMPEPPAIERRATPASGGQSAARTETPPSAAEAAKFKDALVAPSVQQLVNSSIERLKQGAMNGVDARVEAVLRPMLKEWLDTHLPGMVEKIVRAEIDRIVRDTESGNKS